MSFFIEYDKQPQDFLRKTDRHIVNRIMNKIDELLIETAVPRGAKRVVDYEEPTFRIRIGDYRALYRINYKENKIIIAKLDHRKKVYD